MEAAGRLLCVLGLLRYPLEAVARWHYFLHRETNAAWNDRNPWVGTSFNEAAWQRPTNVNTVRDLNKYIEVCVCVYYSLPVCAELRTWRRTGVLSWTTLGRVDTAASAEKHLWRTAWWECSFQSVLPSPWTMGSEHMRGGGNSLSSETFDLPYPLHVRTFVLVTLVQKTQ